MCGSSYWQVARFKSTQNYSTLDETGLVVAGCRHVLALKAVNMFAGEQYGYALFLHEFLSVYFARHHVQILAVVEKGCIKFPSMSDLLNTTRVLSV